MSKIIAFETSDVRFPTSQSLDGSDAMNPDPDYSAAYLRVVTDAGDSLECHGFVFTIGRGNDVEVAAIRSLAPWFLGRDAEEALVDLVDFRYLSDALTPDEALAILRAAEPGRAEREAALFAGGFPAYTTTPGWLGYSDEKLARLSREAVEEGFQQIKLKVGADRADDVRRLGIARETVGPDIRIAVDANQRWDRDEAIDWIRELAPFDLAWVEEPANPDDVLAHAAIAAAIAPTPVATGEHGANRVMFKQFLQADALQVLQIDATRVAGVNENIAIMLLAAKFGVPVCPHAGGVGLCEIVQHLAMFDYLAVSGSTEGRMIEFVDHLHEHFVEPVEVHHGRYWAPSLPGSGAEMLAASVAEFEFAATVN